MSMGKVEKKIYNGWAFEKNEDAMCAMNKQIYNELFEKHKIVAPSRSNATEDNAEIIIELASYEYGRNNFRVIRNEPELSTLELALIMDGGNLCFGSSGYSIFND